MKTILLWLYIVVAVLCALYMLAYEIMHPDLTRVQLFADIWPIAILLTVTIFGASLLRRRS